MTRNIGTTPALTTALMTSIDILSSNRTLQDRTDIRGVICMIEYGIHEVDASYAELLDNVSND